MKVVGSSFQIFALFNGVNIRARMGIINGPLRQEFKKGTNICTPDWYTSPTKPLIFAHLNRDDNGAVLVPNTVDLFYNGVQVAFDGDGLSTTGNLAGVFRRSTQTINIGGNDYSNMIVFEIIKNIVPVSNYDNDTILLKGTTEVDGQSLSFDAVSETVVIVETVGNSTTIFIDGDTDITTQSPTATLNAHVLVNGNAPADLSAYTAKWYKIGAQGDTLVASGVWSYDVAAENVDGTTTYRCDLILNSTNAILGSYYVNVTDYTDPYRVEINIEGITGNQIRDNETCIVTAAVKKSDGTAYPGATTIFSVTDNSGIVIPSLSGERSSIQFTKPDLFPFGGGISGNVASNITV